MTIRAFTVRLYPTKEQEMQLIKSANISRFVYNWTLNEQNENYKRESI